MAFSPPAAPFSKACTPLPLDPNVLAPTKIFACCKSQHQKQKNFMLENKEQKDFQIKQLTNMLFIIILISTS
jgi:hypothetical protein